MGNAHIIEPPRQIRLTGAFPASTGKHVNRRLSVRTHGQEGETVLGHGEM